MGGERMAKKWYSFSFMGVLLVGLGVFLFWFWYQPSKISAQTNSGKPKAVVEQFLNDAMMGRTDTDLLTGPTLARSKLLSGKQVAITQYKVTQGTVFDQYARFEVWTKVKNQLSTYQYHLAKDDQGVWRISLIESVNPALPTDKLNAVPAEHQKVIETFITSLTAGNDVTNLLAYPIRSTVHNKPPRLPTFKPTTPVFEPVAGSSENSLLKVSYTVGEKPISMLVHVISMDNVSQIAEMIPLG
jgi:hypothetical protein